MPWISVVVSKWLSGECNDVFSHREGQKRENQVAIYQMNVFSGECDRCSNLWMASFHSYYGFISWDMCHTNNERNVKRAAHVVGGQGLPVRTGCLWIMCRCTPVSWLYPVNHLHLTLKALTIYQHTHTQAVFRPATSYTGNRSAYPWTACVHTIMRAHDSSSKEGVVSPPPKKKIFSSFIYRIFFASREPFLSFVVCWGIVILCDGTLPL